MSVVKEKFQINENKLDSRLNVAKMSQNKKTCYLNLGLLYWDYE